MSIYGRMKMLEPQSEGELAQMIRASDGPLAVRGGGTRAPVEAGNLTTRGLSGITRYEPGALTLIARAGTPMAEIRAALEAEGQRLAFEPWEAAAVLGRSGASTLGGCVATNASGPRRVVAGAARDAVIGVRFVDGEGQVVKNGGRVMKNVTGLDLAKLMCGSRGRLGVLTEVALKLLPGVAAEATLVTEGLSPEAAVGAMSAALGTPFEVSGAAHDPAASTYLRIEGDVDSVAYRVGRVADALPGDWRQIYDSPWPAIRDAMAFVGGTGDLWRISVRPSHAPALVATLPGRWLMDWGGGLIWAEAPPRTDLRAQMTCPGHATLLRASPDTHSALGTLQPEPAAVARLTRGIAEKFDPKALFAHP